ncbi:hypothetical protein PV325_011434 [Microctonus aethiopoides]|nr:hypothetical protein PV325_011434 [Microctonus aethiopoides]
MSQKLQGTNIRSDACFNPFNLITHSKRRTIKLRKVNEDQLRSIHLPITAGSLQDKICDTCCLRMQKIKKENEDKDINDQVEMKPDHFSIETKKKKVSSFNRFGDMKL